MRLKDKVAVITGGSRGIGFATAKAFLKEGAAVIVAASSPANAQKAVDQLKELFPEGKIGGISPDLTSLEDTRKAFRYVQENFGGSLPAFMAAFGTRKKLRDEEIEEMKALIEKMRG